MKRSEELNASESFSRPSTSDYQRSVGAGGPEGPWPLQILADQLTLNQPEGQIMPTTEFQTSLRPCCQTTVAR